MVENDGPKSPRLVAAAREFNIVRGGLDQEMETVPSSFGVSFKPKAARAAGDVGGKGKTEGHIAQGSPRGNAFRLQFASKYVPLDLMDNINSGLKITVPPRLGKAASPPKPLMDSPTKSPVERRQETSRVPILTGDNFSCIIVEYSPENDQVVAMMSRGVQRSVLWRHPWDLVAAVLKKEAEGRSTAWRGGDFAECSEHLATLSPQLIAGLIAIKKRHVIKNASFPGQAESGTSARWVKTALPPSPGSPPQPVRKDTSGTSLGSSVDYPDDSAGISGRGDAFRRAKDVGGEGEVGIETWANRAGARPVASEGVKRGACPPRGHVMWERESLATAGTSGVGRDGFAGSRTAGGGGAYVDEERVPQGVLDLEGWYDTPTGFSPKAAGNTRTPRSIPTRGPATARAPAPPPSGQAHARPRASGVQTAGGRPTQGVEAFPVLLEMVEARFGTSTPAFLFGMNVIPGSMPGPQARAPHRPVTDGAPGFPRAAGRGDMGPVEPKGPGRTVGGGGGGAAADGTGEGGVEPLRGGVA
ncbi:hypothetical protein T484DRAFT_1882593, partial [Baffinella frigidus]